jgi:hypothetical protein
LRTRQDARSEVVCFQQCSRKSDYDGAQRHQELSPEHWTF